MPRTVAVIDASPIAYSQREASNAFNPPAGRVAIARALRNGELIGHMVGPRRYIMREDLVNWAKTQKDFQK
jgi:hypothetical protein